MFCGSKDMSVECGLWRENAERVKGHVGGVWSRARNRRVGQEGRRWSVVCGEKSLRRSKVKNAPTVKESAPPSLRRRLGGALLIKSSIIQ